MPGSVGLKTHFHKGSGDFWWALVIVLDNLLKCSHIARVITEGMRPELWGKYYVSFLWLIPREKSKRTQKCGHFFPPLASEWWIQHCSDVIRTDINSSMDTWPALLWNFSYWTSQRFGKDRSQPRYDWLRQVRFPISEVSSFSLFFF